VIASARAGARRNTRMWRVAAFAVLLGLCIFAAGAVLADNQVRILFDDVEDTYTPRTTQPNPPTDGCRPAVDDSDDNGCVTEGAGSIDDGGDENPTGG